MHIQVSLNIILTIDIDVGVTVIVTPKWLFVATLTGPYTYNHGMPVYIDGYAYTGIINVQDVEKVWPATAGLVQSQPTIFETLEKSSQLIEPKEEDESL